MQKKCFAKKFNGDPFEIKFIFSPDVSGKKTSG